MNLKQIAQKLGGYIQSKTQDDEGWVRQGKFTPVQQGRSIVSSTTDNTGLFRANKFGVPTFTPLKALGDVKGPTGVTLKQAVAKLPEQAQQDWGQAGLVRDNPLLQRFAPKVIEPLATATELGPAAYMNTWAKGVSTFARDTTTPQKAWDLLGVYGSINPAYAGKNLASGPLGVGMNAITNKLSGKPALENWKQGWQQGQEFQFHANPINQATGNLVNQLATKIPGLQKFTDVALSNNGIKTTDKLGTAVGKWLATSGKKILRAAILETAVETPIWASMTKTDQETYVDALEREALQNLVMNTGMAGLSSLVDARTLAPIVKNSIDTAATNYWKNATSPEGIAKQGGYIDFMGNTVDGTDRTNRFNNLVDIYYKPNATVKEKVDAYAEIRRLAGDVLSKDKIKQLTNIETNKDPENLIMALSDILNKDIKTNRGYKEPFTIRNLLNNKELQRGGMDLTDKTKGFPQTPDQPIKTGTLPPHLQKIVDEQNKIKSDFTIEDVTPKEFKPGENISTGRVFETLNGETGDMARARIVGYQIDNGKVKLIDTPNGWEARISDVGGDNIVRAGYKDKQQLINDVYDILNPNTVYPKLSPIKTGGVSPLSPESISKVEGGGIIPNKYNGDTLINAGYDIPGRLLGEGDWSRGTNQTIPLKELDITKIDQTINKYKSSVREETVRAKAGKRNFLQSEQEKLKMLEDIKKYNMGKSPIKTGTKYKTINEGGIIKEVEGKPIKLVDGVETFIHKGDNPKRTVKGFVISEKSTGRYLATGETENEAIRNAKNVINSMGENNFKQKLSQVSPIKTGGVSPISPESVSKPQNSLISQEAIKRGMDINKGSDMWYLRDELNREMDAARKTYTDIVNKYYDIKVQTKNNTKSISEMMSPTDKKIYQEASDLYDKNLKILQSGYQSKISPESKSTKYKTTVNIQDKNDLNYLRQILGDDRVKDIQAGKMTDWRGTPYEDIARVNIISKTPQTIEQQLAGKITDVKLKSDTFYHGTSSENAKGILTSGFKKGSELPEDIFRGGGYGKIQNSISFAETPKEASIFSTLTKNGEIIEAKLKPNSKVVSIKGIEDANDLDEFIPYLIKQKVDAVYIGGGEKELVVINNKAITPVKSVSPGSKGTIKLKDNDLVKTFDETIKTSPSENKLTPDTIKIQGISPIEQKIKLKSEPKLKVQPYQTSTSQPIISNEPFIDKNGELQFPGVDDEFKVFIGEGRPKAKGLFQKPDLDTSDVGIAKGTILGGGAEKASPEVKQSFANWVNARRASQVEGIIKSREFKDLDSKGIDGIFEFQAGDKSGKFKNLKNYFDTKFNQANIEGIKVNYKEDYLPQMWNNSKEEVNQVFGNRLGLKPSFTIESLIKDYKTGIDQGLTPKFTKISDLVASYEARVNKSIADRKFFDGLKTSNVILPANKAPLDWVTLDPDRFPKLSLSTDQGQYTGIYKAPEDLAVMINNYLSNPSTSPNVFLRNLDKVANWTSSVKNRVLSFGVPGTAVNAHGFNILTRNILSSRNPIEGAITGIKYMLNPNSAGKYLDANLKDAPEAIKNGLTLSANEFKSVLDEPQGIKGKVADTWSKLFEKGLFDKMLPSLKLQKYKEVKAGYIKGGMNESEAGKQAAKFINTTFGGMNWEELGKSRDLQNLKRVLILAPDWLGTNVKLAGKIPQSFIKLGDKTLAPYRRFAATFLGTYITMNVVNKLSSGHFMWQNDPGNTFNIEAGYTEDGKKRYIRPFGTAVDFIRIPIDVVNGLVKGDLSVVTRAVRNRLSIPAGVVVGALTDTDYTGQPIGYRGKDKYGNEIPLKQRAMGVGGELATLAGMPSFAKQGLDLIGGKVSPEEAILQGMELPFRYSGGAYTKTQKEIRDSFKSKGASGKELYDINKQIKGQTFGEKQKESIISSGREKINEIIKEKEKNKLIDEAREEVKNTGQIKEVNGIVLYKDKQLDSETGEYKTVVKSIDINEPINKPNLTGNKEVDKKMTSSYNSKITSRISDIVKLVELEKLDADTAEKMIAELKKTKISTGSKKAKKKITFKVTSPKALPKITLKISSPVSRVKLKSAPKVKLSKTDNRKYTIKA